MTSIRQFLKLLFAPTKSGGEGYWISVRCTKCGELVRARIDLNNELSISDGAQEGQAGYYCRKVLIGEGRCFQPIEVELLFDGNRQLVERKVRGGEFIDG